ncbi:hypothetical protein ACJ73_03541, partial [Blastomyces percursus]
AKATDENQSTQQQARAKSMFTGCWAARVSRAGSALCQCSGELDEPIQNFVNGGAEWRLLIGCWFGGQAAYDIAGEVTSLQIMLLVYTPARDLRHFEKIQLAEEEMWRLIEGKSCNVQVCQFKSPLLLGKLNIRYNFAPSHEDEGLEKPLLYTYAPQH